MPKSKNKKKALQRASVRFYFIYDYVTTTDGDAQIMWSSYSRSIEYVPVALTATVKKPPTVTYPAVVSAPVEFNALNFTVLLATGPFCILAIWSIYVLGKVVLAIIKCYLSFFQFHNSSTNITCSEYAILYQDVL